MNRKSDTARKISFVLGSMRRGGAERVISILANHYTKKGWNVDILLLLSGDCEYELDPNIQLYSFSDEQKSRLGMLPNWLKKIRGYVKANRPDIILSFAARINIIMYFATLGMKTKKYVSERNDPQNDGRSWVVRFITNQIYPKVDGVIFQTEWAKNCFKSVVQGNGQIIYNPVNRMPIKKYQWHNRFVSVGSLEEQKNQHLLIKAFYMLWQEDENITLTIYGEGTLRNQLENEIKQLGLENHVFLPGKVSDIHSRMREEDVFVLSSNYEGLSNALLEAMMQGMPCISTRCAGSNEVIENGVNGLLTDIGDVNGLYKAMKSFLLDHEFAEKCGRSAKEKSEVFDTEHIIKMWESILQYR